MTETAPRPRTARDDGFMLIELMTVVLILLVLVVIAIPSYVNARGRTAAEVCAANRRLGAQADYRFYLDNDVWSGSFADLTGEYLKHPLVCPSGGVLVWLEEPTADDPYRTLVCSIHGTGDGTDATAVESPADIFRRVTTDLIDRIQEYRDEHKSWPSSREPRSYTDLGLDPDDWGDPQGHLYYDPDGNRVNVAPEDGWVIQVTTANGSTRTISSDDDRALIYDMKTGSWYYGSVSSKNRVDIDTLIVAEDPDAGHDD